jgi:DNA-binding LacI/PurR family transcriptional regulator
VTSAQPVAEIAKSAIACLLERISGADDTPPPRDIVFQPQFLSGDSCLPLGPVEVAALRSTSS